MDNLKIHPYKNSTQIWENDSEYNIISKTMDRAFTVREIN